MDENKSRESNLAEEFRQLGKNLTEAMVAAWERPERKKLQDEIVNGLTELGNTLRQEARHISESPTGQKVKAEAEDIRERIRRGDVENKAREELLAALQAANDMLRQAIHKISTEDRARYSQEPGERKNPGGQEEDKESTPMKDTGHREVHPDGVESDVSQASDRQEVHPDDAE
jgi:predicted thioesterase